MIQELIEILNKIKEDKRPQDYKIVYIDGIKKETGFEKILKVDSLNLFIEKNGKEINIPLHKIRKVVKDDRFIWAR